MQRNDNRKRIERQDILNRKIRTSISIISSEVNIYKATVFISNKMERFFVRRSAPVAAKQDSPAIVTENSKCASNVMPVVASKDSVHTEAPSLAQDSNHEVGLNTGGNCIDTGKAAATVSPADASAPEGQKPTKDSSSSHPDSTNPDRNKVRDLKSVFPHLLDSALFVALSECNNCVDEVTMRLISDSEYMKHIESHGAGEIPKVDCTVVESPVKVKAKSRKNQQLRQDRIAVPEDIESTLAAAPQDLETRIKSVQEETKAVLGIGMPNDRKSTKKTKQRLLSNLGRVKCRSNKKVELLEVGEIREGKKWHNKGYIFPSGYKSSTMYKSSTKIGEQAVHICSIVDDGFGKPLFRIVTEDRQDEPLDGRSASACWKQILKRINVFYEANDIDPVKTVRFS